MRFFVVFAVLALSWSPTTSWAADRTPFLMDGKTSLFQRVLTRPGAAMVGDPGAEEAGAEITPFSVFYAYDRKFFGGKDWVQVGARADGAVEGWVEASKSIDWKQTITVAFTNPADRKRTLLYRDRDTLLDLMESETVVRDVASHREAIANRDIPADFPVLSIEPATAVDIEEEFYLLPILDAEEVYLSSGFTSRLLGIASVTKTTQDADDNIANPTIQEDLIASVPEDARSLADARIGVVFVVDTTTSMGPYIDQTRDAVRRISTSLQDQGLGDRLGFGLVGFRDSLEGAPQLDYVSKVYASLDAGVDHAGFLDSVNDVQAAEVSSKGFVEDAYSGILNAIENINWGDFDHRFIVLITDAGARESADPLGSTGLGVDQVRQMAEVNQIRLLTLHLKTEEGTPNHSSATAQYSQLGKNDTGRTRYYAVPAGDVEKFAASLDSVSAAVLELIGSSAQGQLVQPEAAPEEAATEEEKELIELKQSLIAAGLAMQLEYLGRQEGAEVPTVFEAWMADRALENPDTAVVSVRLLMTKNQLSDMQDKLRLILDAGILGQMAPQDFFNQLKSAAAAMSRDPDQVNNSEASNLAELGLMGEYLEDLPYQSKIMSIDQQLWLDWSVGEQQAFLDEVQAKINLYEKFHDDTDRWVLLDSGSSPGETVYPVPLDALP